MKRHGTPMKARIDKRLTEKGARKRFEISFSDDPENEIHEAEIELIEHDADVANGKPCRHCGDRKAI